MVLNSDAGFTLWLTGLSGAGKSTLAELLAGRLRAAGKRVEVLDGDALRAHISKDLGFSREDRETQIARLGYLCELLNRNGVVTIVAAITPIRAAREQVRAKLPQFVEVHVACAMETLAQRDPKGLYQKALRGEIKNFTGVSDPYEPPHSPELELNTGQEDAEQSALRVWTVLQERNLV